MAVADLLGSPIIIMILALATGWLLYAWSKSIAPPSLKIPGRAMPYVGGEPAEAQTFTPGYQFYYVALFFVAVHITALVLAIAPPDAPLWATLGYLAIIAVAITILRWEQ